MLFGSFGPWKWIAVGSVSDKTLDVQQFLGHNAHKQGKRNHDDCTPNT